MYQYLKTTEAVVICNGAMESGDHFKNGVSSKNLMSRGNFFKAAVCLCFFLFVAPLVVVGQGQENDLVYLFETKKTADVYGKYLTQLATWILVIIS